MIISFKNVCCGYKKHILISDLNFQFETGQAVCILGANGIGKTTIFKSVLGHIDLLAGEILVDSMPLKNMSVKKRSYIFSYVPQAKDRMYAFKVKDVILMGRAPYIPKFSSPSKEDNIIVKFNSEIDLEKFQDSFKKAKIEL